MHGYAVLLWVLDCTILTNCRFSGSPNVQNPQPTTSLSDKKRSRLESPGTCCFFSFTNPKKTWLLKKKGLTAPKGGAFPPGAFLGDTLLTSFESEKIAEKTGGIARLGAGPFFPGSEIYRLCKHRSAIIGSMVLLYIIYIFTWFLWDQLVGQVNIHNRRFWILWIWNYWMLYL